MTENSSSSQCRLRRISLAFSAITLVELLTGAPPLRAQTTELDIDAAACPSRVGFAFTSPYTGKIYAGGAYRGTDSFFGQVYYTFSGVPDQTGTWSASGNFYLYGLECRLGTWLLGGIIMPPQSRIEFVEEPVLGFGGGGGSCAYQIISDPSECTDQRTGSGGGGSTGGGSGGSSGGSGNLCVDLSLDPGCYDVYVDGQFEGTVCCG